MGYVRLRWKWLNIRPFLQILLNPKLFVNPVVTRTKQGCNLTGALDLSVQVWRTVAPMSGWGHWASWWFCRSSSLPPPVSGLHPNCHLSFDEESHVICSRGTKGWLLRISYSSEECSYQTCCSYKTFSGNYLGVQCWVDLGNKELKNYTLEITSSRGGECFLQIWNKSSSQVLMLSAAGHPNSIYPLWCCT